MTFFVAVVIVIKIKKVMVVNCIAYLHVFVGREPKIMVGEITIKNIYIHVRIEVYVLARKYQSQNFK